MQTQAHFAAMTPLTHVLAAVLLAASVSQLPAGEPMTDIPAIRRLSSGEAAKAIPVKVEGVCVWKEQGHFVISDGNESIWVSIRYAMTSGLFPRETPKSYIKPGVGLRVEGVTNEGGYAPVIFPTSIRPTGTFPLPPPKRVALDRLVSGSEDGQWVEFDGVIQEIFTRDEGGIGAGIMICGQHAWLQFGEGTKLDPGRMIDATVRVRGICAPDQNLRSEALGMKFYVTDADSIEVITPPPNPFHAPKVELGRLLPFSPDPKPYNRKVTSGVVAFAVPGRYFFLQDGRSSVRVSSTATDVKKGDQVEISGFVDTSQIFASMRNVLVRKLGVGAVPPPVRVSPKELVATPVNRGIRGELPGDLNGRFVTLRGKIWRIDWNKDRLPGVVWIDSEDWIFPVTLPNRQPLTPKQAALWVPGAEAEVSGLCELEFGDTREARENYRPKGFHLLLESPQGLQILKSPSWWTPFHLALALGIASFVALALLAWTWILRGQVAKQTRIIGEKIHAAATQEERNRIARDLHDSIEQQLAGVSMHLFGASASMPVDPGAAMDALELARRMLKHTQRETRTSIRELRSPLLEGQELAGAIRSMAIAARTADGPQIDVEISEEVQGLTMDGEYQFLRLAQEALNNALKHSNARRILVSLTSSPAETCLSVSDDGIGFRPGSTDTSDLSHFGLLGMHERAARIGASLKIISAAGKGCTIKVTLRNSPDSIKGHPASR